MASDLYSKLIALLDENGAQYRLYDHEPEGRTEIVSGMRGNKVSQAAKCIVILVKIGKKEKRYVLGVVPGDAKVDLNAVKALYDGTYVSFATPEIAEELAGSVAGTILPFSFHPDLELIVDPVLLKNEELFFNAARLDRSLALRTSDYEKIAKPRLEAIAQYGDAPSAPATKKQAPAPEKKEPDADELHKLRHSLAHVLAQAVLTLWPDTKITIGPPIDYGCYYDFLFAKPISVDDFGKIEKEMRKIIHQGQTFRCDTLTPDEAKAYWKGESQPFKVELIEDLVKNENVQHVTHYVNLGPKGEETFTDLCRGGHVENLKEIPADGFKLMTLAGAYWRGDEKREQLTRVYVAAFPSKEELDAYLLQQEEARKRDHRKIGKEMDLFVFSEMVGPGLPLWTPKGALIVDEVEKLIREKEMERGYKRVRTPHIAKGALYAQTGHLAHYRGSMFPPMVLPEGEEEYFLKPMNCPHHHQIFASRQRSYRDLPLRYAEFGHCYRYEDSGTLFGLMRVRSLCQNDAHIYCTEEQFEEEFMDVVNLYLDYFALLGVEKYVMRLSLHDPKELGKKYVDNGPLWIKTEDMVRKAMTRGGIPFVEVPNEAAFYGPKVDVQVWSAIGREFSLATNQVDFDVPNRVGLRYVAKDGSEQAPLCIHRAPLGSEERFVGFLIEHFAGHFPTWLAPVQCAVIPVAGAHEAYAVTVAEALEEHGIRFEVYGPEQTLGKRIREGELQRVTYLLVLGDREQADGQVTVRNVKTKQQTTLPLAQFVSRVAQEIAERTLEPSVG